MPPRTGSTRSLAAGAILWLSFVGSAGAQAANAGVSAATPQPATVQTPTAASPPATVQAPATAPQPAAATVKTPAATPQPAAAAPPAATPPSVEHVEQAADAESPAAPPPAASESDAPPLPHYFASASAGVPLRLAKDATFDQGTFAPAYADALLGYVFAGQGRVRHGAGLGMSLNLSEDGGFTEPVLKYAQFVIMPSYLLDLELASSWLTLAHAGLPIVVHGGTTVGAELAFALGYRLLAGCGVFTEASFDLFIGTASTLHPMMSLEAGLFFDYEVLP